MINYITNAIQKSRDECMKIIIFGCGKIGRTIIESLVDEGHDIVAVDSNRSVVDEVTDIYDVMGLCGNGVDSDTMSEAGIDEAELFVAVTGSDELNMLACFLAKKMGAKYTLARIRNPEYNDDSLGIMKHHLDLSVVLTPEKLVAKEIFNNLRYPSSVKVETFSNRTLEIVELHIGESSPFAGSTLSELRKNYTESFLVCCVLRDGNVFIPDGNCKLQVGDKIGLTASRTEIIKLLRSIGLPSKQPKNVIIIGGGRISYYLSKMLISSGVNVKIIEMDKNICHELALALPEATVIMGDGMKPEILLEEGIATSDAFIALTGKDETNILTSFFVAGQTMSTIISKINRSDLASSAEKMGLECIISPQQTVSNVVSSYVRALQNSVGSNVETLYKIMDGKAEVLEFKVSGDFKYTSIPLKDMTLKNNILISGIIRGRKPIIPTGNDTILSGDRVIVLAAGHLLSNLEDIIDNR